MTRKGLAYLNKNALIEIIMKLQEESKLLKKQNIIYTCMECSKDFEQDQVMAKDKYGNVLCPYCNSGDIDWSEENE